MQSASKTLNTPPSSPTLPPAQQPLTLQHAQQFLELLKVAAATNTLSTSASTPGGPVVEPPAPEDPKTEAISRASRLEYKTVNEVWDEKAYQYKIAEPVAPTGEVNELDQYVFVNRIRIDKKTKDSTFYIDVKSKGLRDVLRKVLKDVRGICLREDKPSVEQNLLYNFLPELELYQSSMNVDSENKVYLKHLDLLISFIETTYASTTERLEPLLKNREITYDLLWALFKPNSEVYTTCPGTGEPRCVKFNHGEEKTRQSGSKYFHLDCRYFDFDGKVFGEAALELAIEKFRGTKRIDFLQAFPLEYHRKSSEIRARLIGYGRTFNNLRGVHHRQYQGTAFCKDKDGNRIKVSVKSRIMVDTAYFRQINPNYARPQIDKSPGTLDLSAIFDFTGDSIERKDQIKRTDVDLTEMKDQDFLISSPTVLGFSLGDKLWLEFAVANISNITWNPSSFDNLRIPAQQKEIIQALSKTYLSRDSHPILDDFVLGKGRGLVTLLHGPPGVGKTLTAEAISEYLRRPLYVISAGELGTTADALEERLSHIFKIVTHWKATLLLDEADVFVEQRATNDIHRNALVCVFLRKLEYYEGILFLTTNRVKTIDEAIASRIHLALRYGPLDRNAREAVWRSFLNKASTTKGAADFTEKDLDILVGKDLNGREIKNAVFTAQALASHKETQVSLSHLEFAISANVEFQRDFMGGGKFDNIQSYA